jgi:hypothetical protein
MRIKKSTQQNSLAKLGCLFVTPRDWTIFANGYLSPAAPASHFCIADISSPQDADPPTKQRPVPRRSFALSPATWEVATRHLVSIPNVAVSTVDLGGASTKRQRSVRRHPPVQTADGEVLSLPDVSVAPATSSNSARLTWYLRPCAAMTPCAFRICLPTNGLIG